MSGARSCEEDHKMYWSLRPCRQSTCAAKPAGQLAEGEAKRLARYREMITLGRCKKEKAHPPTRAFKSDSHNPSSGEGSVS